jgi:hypothetical protein
MGKIRLLSQNIFLDLYASLVAPTLKTPLDVESWRRGDEIPQNCSLKYEVQNVEDMKVKFKITLLNLSILGRHFNNF